jgi:hypothetical protein
MERVYFKYQVLTMLRLSREEVEALAKACESHYDRAVQGLIIPGPNAILNAARFSFEKDPNGKEYADIEVTLRQLDTLAKATESVQSAWVDRAGMPEFFEAFLGLLREAGEEHRRLNTTHFKAIKAKMGEKKDP